MLDSLYISATGLQANQLRIDSISNNLSNVGTPAFKKARVAFDDLLYRKITPDLLSDPTGLTQLSNSGSSLGSGAAVSRVDRLFTQGALQPTQRALDLAVHGQGFFELERADGSFVYTRGGAFSVNDLGEIQTADGLTLSSPLRIPPDTLEILVGESGEVSVRLPDEATPVTIGQLELALFMNTDGLRPLGAGLYEPSEDSGQAFLARPGEEGLGAVRQGFLEASNVDFSEELVELLLAQRAFQLNARTLQASDELLAEINSLRR
jgi:flagellar basal-body rod protein FlgG